MPFFAVNGNEESQLIADKFKNYNKNIRPARNPEEKVKVQVKLTLTNLISLVTNFFLVIFLQTLIHVHVHLYQCI